MHNQVVNRKTSCLSGGFLVFVKTQDYLTVSSESNVTSYAGNRVIDPSERLDNLAFTNDEIPHQPTS